MTKMDMVRDFTVAMGQPVDVDFDKAEWPLISLRSKLIEEEAGEAFTAMREETKADLLKELCDVLYVTYGAAVTFGLDLDTAFNRVHQSNLSKLGPDGKPIYNSAGKVLKGENYKKPDLSDLV